MVSGIEHTGLEDVDHHDLRRPTKSTAAIAIRTKIRNGSFQRACDVSGGKRFTARIPVRNRIAIPQRQENLPRSIILEY